MQIRKHCFLRILSQANNIAHILTIYQMPTICQFLENRDLAVDKNKTILTLTKPSLSSKTQITNKYVLIVVSARGKISLARKGGRAAV